MLNLFSLLKPNDTDIVPILNKNNVNKKNYDNNQGNQIQNQYEINAAMNPNFIKENFNHLKDTQNNVKSRVKRSQAGESEYCKLANLKAGQKAKGKILQYSGEIEAKCAPKGYTLQQGPGCGQPRSGMPCNYGEGKNTHPCAVTNVHVGMEAQWFWSRFGYIDYEKLKNCAPNSGIYATQNNKIKKINGEMMCDTTKGISTYPILRKC